MLAEPWLAALIGIPTVVATILSQVSFWQRKEYRFDRMRAFIRNDGGLQQVYPTNWLFWAMLSTSAAWIAFVAGSHRFTEVLGWLGLMLFTAHHGTRSLQRGVFRPEKTFKAISFTSFLIVLTSVYLYFTYTSLFYAALQWATLILLLPLISVGANAIHNIPFAWKKQQAIIKATNLRSQLKDIQVVGITGSYGKTSTKFFLKQILDHAGVSNITSSARVNDAYPLALEMLKRLVVTPLSKGGAGGVFIAELAAYRRGEIKQQANMIKPTIGVVTAIGNQHIELFGSQENIRKGKLELLDALPENGIAIVGDTVKTEKAVMRFSLENKAADVHIENIQTQPESVTGDLFVSKKSQKVSIPLASTGMIESLLGAVAVASALKVPAEKIFSAVSSIESYERTMQIKHGENNSIIIDDSYSTGEAAALNAINHLARFPQKNKIILMGPLIELGNQTGQVREKIKKAAKQANAKLIWINSQKLAPPITKEGLGGAVVLIEGRVPDHIRKKILI